MLVYNLHSIEVEIWIRKGDLHTTKQLFDAWERQRQLRIGIIVYFWSERWQAVLFVETVELRIRTCSNNWLEIGGIWGGAVEC